MLYILFAFDPNLNCEENEQVWLSVGVIVDLLEKTKYSIFYFIFLRKNIHKKTIDFLPILIYYKAYLQISFPKKTCTKKFKIPVTFLASFNS